MADTDYGIDVACLDDLDARGVEISGPDLVAQDFYHSITTPEGGFIGAPDAKSIDVRSFVQRKMGPGFEAEIEAKLIDIARDDERILDAKATAKADPVGLRIVVEMVVQLAGVEAPFRWVFVVTADTVQRALGT